MLLTQMREYWRIYRPAVFLFERSVSGGPLSVRTAQAIFQHAKAASGIQKKVSAHTLRLCQREPRLPKVPMGGADSMGAAAGGRTAQYPILSCRLYRPPRAQCTVLEQRCQAVQPLVPLRLGDARPTGPAAAVARRTARNAGCAAHPDPRYGTGSGAVAFIRRFLLHVLPHGFHKIRHFGGTSDRKAAANDRYHKE